MPDRVVILSGLLLAFFQSFGFAHCAEGIGLASSSSSDEFFEKRIRPILVDRCYKCHSAQAEKLKGGLRLDTREAILKGGETGPAIVPGKPGESLLIRAIGYEDENLQMPPKEPLPASVIADFVEWIHQGAPDPRGTSVEHSMASGTDFSKGRTFWSFQRPKIQPLPRVANGGWAQRRIDWFVLAKLEQAQLSPSPQADARALARRATFDLTGLPPTPGQVEAFARDQSPNAFAKLVDRLLATPAYGERWARFWLDKARYTDVVADFESGRASPWLYRDWVIEAFQRDMPYDQFVKEQLASDLMPECGPRDLAALGFLGLSPTYWKELKLQRSLIQTVVAEEWEERMDALGRTFLGLTLACARCHDHKFDPISQEDYYALAGVLASTRLADRPLIPDKEFEPVRLAREETSKLEEQIAKIREKADKTNAETKIKIAQLQEQVHSIKTNTPGYDQLMANAVRDAALYVLEDGPDRTKLDYRPGESRDLPIHLRGNPAKEGRIVPRGFLQVLSPGKRKEFKRGSGRLELAEAILNEGEALSARVIVNRIWEQHFGKGLVDTPSNFGARGSTPTHPELLDDLTARFVQNGWSIKWLHREIMLSSAYQQSTLYVAASQQTDPENRFLWRMNRRRLDIEAWRDSMLAVSESLDLHEGGPPHNLGDSSNSRRTIYGRVDRRNLDDMLRLYDFPDPSIHGETRVPTTTPIQQLFTLNSDFIQSQAAHLLDRLKRERIDGWQDRVQRSHEWLFGRPANAQELALAHNFVRPERQEAQAVERDWKLYLHVLLGSNEFMFVD